MTKREAKIVIRHLVADLLANVRANGGVFPDGAVLNPDGERLIAAFDDLRHSLLRGRRSPVASSVPSAFVLPYEQLTIWGRCDREARA